MFENLGHLPYVCLILHVNIGLLHVLGKMIPISTDNIYMYIHIRTQRGNSIFSLWNMQNPVNTTLTTHHIFSKYWDILSTYHTCPPI